MGANKGTKLGPRKNLDLRLGHRKKHQKIVRGLWRVTGEYKKVQEKENGQPTRFLLICIVKKSTFGKVQGGKSPGIRNSSKSLTGGGSIK